MDTHHILPCLQPDRTPRTRIVPAMDSSLAVTCAVFTDTPVTFGEGNIGRIAVNVTANRLLASGATPRYVAATFTIDRDTPVELINIIAQSMHDMAVQAEMEWTVNDTIVLDSGPASGMAISVFGMGTMPPDLDFSKRCLNPGDVIIATGDAGSYGTAIEAVRRNIEPLVTADGAPLIDIVHSLLRVVPQTRRLIFPFGGINRALRNLELTHNTNIVRSAIPISDAVGTACSIMGVDPLDMACAGMMLAIVPESDAQEAIAAIRRSDYGNRAAIIGHIA